MRLEQVNEDDRGPRMLLIHSAVTPNRDEDTEHSNACQNNAEKTNTLVAWQNFFWRIYG